MSRFAMLLPLIFAAASAASCSQTASAVDGSGFQALHPSADTRKFIVKNDLPFAREVVAHNETCAKQPGCKKD